MERQYKDCKVGVCVPIYDSVTPVAYSNHIAALSKWNREICEIVLFVVGQSNTADARNGMAEGSLEHKCTHIMCLDACHLMPDNLLQLLIEADFDIVSGLVCAQLHPFEQACFMADRNGEYQCANLPIDDKVHKVDICALGCSLIKRQVFLDVGRPYFLNSSHELGHMRIRYNKKHDVSFQERARAKGASIGVHTGALIGHVGRDIVITPDKGNPKGYGGVTFN